MNAASPPEIRDDTWEMIQRLVAFDTTSRESNLGLIEWVRDWLGAQGIECRLTWDRLRAKANLFATLDPGHDGPPRHGGIILSGHSDVVPVDGQDWRTPPFTATRIGERIFGRGTADMKGFIGAALAMTPRFMASPLQMPLHFALSYDEEVGCLGVRSLIDDLTDSGLRPSACIVGEPTGMEVVVAHKGKRAFRCRVHGREAHSALTPLGVNAIEYAARLIVHIRSIADRMRGEGPFQDGFDVPFTTLQTGTIRGGTATNIVPRECSFDFEFRYLPGVDPDTIEREIREHAESTLLPAMRAVAADADIRFEPMSDTPGLSIAETDRLTTLARSLAREQRIGRVGYATEAGLFQQAGVHSIVCGPGHIEQAHRPDEYVAVEQIARCEAFLNRLLEHLRTPASR
jgi:acetylornithine deacetylase